MIESINIAKLKIQEADIARTKIITVSRLLVVNDQMPVSHAKADLNILNL